MSDSPDAVPTVAYVSLGCRVNRVETDGIIERLRQAGVNMESRAVVEDHRFAGMTFVLTGALSRFTREEAGAVIEIK